MESTESPFLTTMDDSAVDDCEMQECKEESSELQQEATVVVVVSLRMCVRVFNSDLEFLGTTTTKVQVLSRFYVFNKSNIVISVEQ